MEAKFVNGVAHGKFKVLYTEPQSEECGEFRSVVISHYVNGQRAGYFQKFSSWGKLREEGYYKNRSQHGEQKNRSWEILYGKQIDDQKSWY